MADSFRGVTGYVFRAAGESAYSTLKWDLFTRFANDRAAYIQGKADFVTQLVQRAIAQS
jgi:GrpB-like predicted nucleotidyltransferase (UPF0157 family)